MKLARRGFQTLLLNCCFYGYTVCLAYLWRSQHGNENHIMGIETQTVQRNFFVLPRKTFHFYKGTN